MPIDPNAPKPGDAPKYHIKGDPLGRACFPKPQPEPKSLPVIKLRPWCGRSDFREE